jgi:hypothetical protein
MAASPAEQARPGRIRWPLGQALPVREPIWQWGSGSQLADGNGAAIGLIFAGVLFDGAAALVLVHVIKLVRRWLRHHQQGRQMAGPAGCRVASFREA